MRLDHSFTARRSSFSVYVIDLAGRWRWVFFFCRGEKAFCSSSCRSQEIMDEEMEEQPTTASSGSSPQSTCSAEALPGAE